MDDSSAFVDRIDLLIEGRQGVSTTTHAAVIGGCRPASLTIEFSFWSSSSPQDLGRAAVSWRSEEWIPPREKFIFSFNSKDELKKWHLYSDSEYGGMSSASLEITEIDNGAKGVFSGNLSLDVAENSKISRSGFCGMRSKQFDGYIDLDAFDTIAMKLRGDGRCYISTIYTENWVNSPAQPEDNTWQAFVYLPRDNWYIAKIPLARYSPTWRGNVIEVDMEMNPSRILGMSLSVNASGGFPGAINGPGEFRVEIDWIKAMRTSS